MKGISTVIYCISLFEHVK